MMSETTTTPAQAVRPTFTFRREMRIEWGDCDPAGIVFYPRYLEFFDANTAYLFEAAGLPKADLVKTYDIVGLPLVDVQAKFLKPSGFGDRISIESNVGEWRGSSVRIEHRIFRDGEFAVQGTRVAHGRARIRSAPMPSGSGRFHRK